MVNFSSDDLGHSTHTHPDKTSASLDASSGLNRHSVPFSACSLSSSLNDLFPFVPAGPFGVASASPFAGNATELRGVFVFVSISVVKSPSFTINERSQSSFCDPFECRESWDMENSVAASESDGMACGNWLARHAIKVSRRSKWKVEIRGAIA